MSSKGYFRYVHKCDIYVRSTTTNAAGQRVASWAKKTADADCWFTAVRGSVRSAPTVEYQETLTIIFPGDIVLSEYDRIYDIKDRKGNIIEAGPFEVVSNLKKTGFYGQVHHTTATVRHVMER